MINYLYTWAVLNRTDPVGVQGELVTPQRPVRVDLIKKTVRL